MIETQFSTKIAIIRSDNGTEFINSSCGSFFAEKSILHQRSVVKTPQQNGVAERKHRHLLDTARALRIQAGFPKSFWGECVLSGSHIINQLPMANLLWKSIFEILYGQPPTYEDLRAIDCLYNAANIGETDKFEPKAHKSVLVRYSFGIKGYKLYDLTNKKIFHNRDIIFKEDIFPFKTKCIDVCNIYNDPVLPCILPDSNDINPLPSTSHVSFNEHIYSSPLLPNHTPHNDSATGSNHSNTVPSPLNQSPTSRNFDSLQHTNVVAPRRSCRTKQTPVWLQGWV